MSKSLRNRILIILGVIAACLYFTFPFEKRINLGLDLKGGIHIILKVDNENLPEAKRADAVLKSIEILRNRIDSLGVGETLIQQEGQNQILVQLPGVTNREAAMEMIGRVAHLEFKLVSDDQSKLKDALAGNVPPGYVLKKIKKEGDEPILIEEKTAMGGESIENAMVDFDSHGLGEPYISLRFNSKGAGEFATLTQQNVGKKLAIILDDEVMSAPNIREAILGGNAQITGRFSFEEASLLALALRTGALPAPMHVEEERTIGPLLGKDSIHAGFKATVIGVILIFVFMFGYYWLSGLIANIALILNFLLILGTMGLLRILSPDSPMTLTLPGIAGIILTLGMAVDSNILINERIREEINNGQPLQSAVNNGFSRALHAIIDSHITNLIAAFMLFQFGSGPIKGFAVTLTIGLITSLFTSIYVTRTIFDILIQNKILKSFHIVTMFSKLKINFFSKKFLVPGITLILILVGSSLYTIVTKKDSAYGIDFAGGQIQQYKFQKPVSAEELRSVLKSSGIEDAVIQQFDKNPENVIIRTPEDEYNKVAEAFKTKIQDNTFEVLRIEKVGPVVGKELRGRAVKAMIFALIGILIYIAIRFKHWDFATAGVIALLHDVFVALGVCLMLNRQIDLLMITALLTIAGYSINDTIIIYDRVRENLQKMKKNTLEEVINYSINQTFGRTILTTVATLLSVIALYLFGGEVLNTFALCLIVGFIAGTYSTVYIVSPLFLAWQNRSKK